ncbi:MAG: F0F1 ATP synthase subunit A [Gemmatimonadetes bacterium]|nr:F0F1 ATP synthase subunit A [Gemmatimonadota bacterium]
MSIGGYDLMNTTVMFWAAMLVLIVLSYLATRRLSLVPGRLQSVFELVIEFFTGVAEAAAGERAARRFLPLVVAIFLGVLLSNWLGTLPGVGTIGRVETIGEWVEHHVQEELATVAAEHPGLGHGELEALALVHVLEAHRGDTFVAFDGVLIPPGRGEAQRVPLDKIVSYTAADLRHVEEVAESHGDLERDRVYQGILHDIEASRVKEPFVFDEGSAREKRFDFTGSKAGILVPFFRGSTTDLNTTLAIALVAMTTVQIWGFMTLGFRGYGKRFMDVRGGPVAMFVGLLEVFGEIARVVSFTFRLFGNMFAGEILLIAIGFLLPLIGLIPFLGLELFIGLIQAFIFAMLTLVFGSIAVTHGGHRESENAH